MDRMFCNKCGSQLPEGASFCTACGARQNSSTESTPTTALEPVESNELTSPQTYQSGYTLPEEPPAKPKKKRIALKIILALVLVLVLGAGVTVLGYYTFLPAKTTLTIAQYATVRDSYDTIDKQLTQFREKVLDPFYQDTIKTQTEIALSLDDEFLSVLLGNDNSTIGIVKDALKNASISFGSAVDAKNKKQIINFGVKYMQNPLLTVNAYVDGKKFGLSVPELSRKTIVGDLSNLDNLANLLPSVDEEALEMFENMDPWFGSRIYDDIKIDRAALKKVMQDFSKTIVDSIDPSNMSIKRGRTTDLFGEEIKCQEITIKLNQKAQKKLVANVLSMAKDSQEFYNLTIGNILKLVDILSENPLYKDMLDMVDLEDLLSKSNYKAMLNGLKSNLDETMFPEKVTAKVYIKGLDIVKYEITLAEDDEEILLTLEQVNEGLSHKTRVTLSQEDNFSGEFSIIKDYDASSDICDFDVKFSFTDYYASFDMSLSSKEELQGKNEVKHDVNASIIVNEDYSDDSSSVEITAKINGTKTRNGKKQVTESSYKGNLSVALPEKLVYYYSAPESVSIGFSVDTQNTYGQKVEIPKADETLDLATATEDDFEELGEEIYEQISPLIFMLQGF